MTQQQTQGARVWTIAEALGGVAMVQPVQPHRGPPVRVVEAEPVAELLEVLIKLGTKFPDGLGFDVQRLLHTLRGANA